MVPAVCEKVQQLRAGNETRFRRDRYLHKSKCLSVESHASAQRFRCVSKVTGGPNTPFPIPDSPTTLKFLTPKEPATHL
ncbi:hypothetical protein SFRURICE_018058 [Spodoptera frugiperda]|nr:hypothetical protein SFRURICE_018058 [Spodoptera frugiperda]